MERQAPGRNPTIAPNSFLLNVFPSLQEEEMQIQN
jgi:hypothetical protein